PAGPFAVVAESFSGPLGIRLAQRHADQLRALVLAATFVRNPSFAASMARLIGPYLFKRKPPEFALRWTLLGSDAGNDELEQLRSISSKSFISQVQTLALACARPHKPGLHADLLPPNRDTLQGFRSLYGLRPSVLQSYQPSPAFREYRACL